MQLSSYTFKSKVRRGSRKRDCCFLVDIWYFYSSKLCLSCEKVLQCFDLYHTLSSKLNKVNFSLKKLILASLHHKHENPKHDFCRYYFLRDFTISDPAAWKQSFAPRDEIIPMNRQRVTVFNIRLGSPCRTKQRRTFHYLHQLQFWSRLQ